MVSRKVKTEISDIKGPLYDDVVNLIEEEADGALEFGKTTWRCGKRGTSPGNFQAVKIST